MQTRHLLLKRSVARALFLRHPHPPTAHSPRPYVHTHPSPRGQVQRHSTRRKQIRRLCLSSKQDPFLTRREQPHKWPSLRNPRSPLRAPRYPHPPRQRQQCPRSRTHPHHFLASLVRRGCPCSRTSQTAARRRPREPRRKRDRIGHHFKVTPLHKKHSMSESHTCNLGVCAFPSNSPSL